MSQPLQDKVALVTGGSRGLGAATARSLADAGAGVAITYVASDDKAAEVVKELEDKGVQAAAFRSDQADAGAPCCTASSSVRAPLSSRRPIVDCRVQNRDVVDDIVKNK